MCSCVCKHSLRINKHSSAHCARLGEGRIICGAFLRIRSLRSGTLCCGSISHFDQPLFLVHTQECRVLEKYCPFLCDTMSSQHKKKEVLMCFLPPGILGLRRCVRQYKCLVCGAIREGKREWRKRRSYCALRKQSVCIICAMNRERRRDMRHEGCRYRVSTSRSITRFPVPCPLFIHKYDLRQSHFMNETET